MNQGNTLMNFRIPVQLKKELEIICKSKNIKLTYVLLYLIKQFVNKELTDNLKNKLLEQNITNQLQDPKNKPNKPLLSFKSWLTKK
jgi:hypothetical protein